VSCLCSQPIVAAVGSLAILLGLWLIDIAAGESSGLLRALSMIRHFDAFGRGLLAVPDLTYYGVLILLCLLLGIRRLDADRLR
jgi:ABC-2 type transport system permease protein